MRYVRYVVTELDESSGYRLGVIRAAWYKDEERVFSATESARLKAIFNWLNANLPRPERVTRTRNASHKKKRALSWFKETAQVPMGYVREIVELMKTHDIVVEMITTERPGYIVYEDEFQVVAEPFADTRA